MEPEDIDSIQRIKRGETEAYEVLVRKYHRHLLNFIFRIVRDESIVEDIGQDVFISVYRALPKFDENRGVPFGAWLFIIARNQCISELRKKKIANFVPIFEDFPSFDHSPASDEMLIQKEQRAALLQTLEKLEEPFKKALLQSLEGASIDEIARACNVPINTIKTRLFRARDKLRKALNIDTRRA
jgi:RNA polymerase sigma-70 factor, ECF subfamily